MSIFDKLKSNTDIPRSKFIPEIGPNVLMRENGEIVATVRSSDRLSEKLKHAKKEKIKEVLIDINKHTILIHHSSQKSAPNLIIDGTCLEGIESIEYIWVTADGENESKLYLEVKYFEAQKKFADNKPSEYLPPRGIKDRRIEKGNRQDALRYREIVNTGLKLKDESVPTNSRTIGHPRPPRGQAPPPNTKRKESAEDGK